MMWMSYVDSAAVLVLLPVIAVFAGVLIWSLRKTPPFPTRGHRPARKQSRMGPAPKVGTAVRTPKTGSQDALGKEHRWG